VGGKLPKDYIFGNLESKNIKEKYSGSVGKIEFFYPQDNPSGLSGNPIK